MLKDKPKFKKERKKKVELKNQPKIKTLFNPIQSATQPKAFAQDKSQKSMNVEKIAGEQSVIQLRDRKSEINTTAVNTNPDQQEKFSSALASTNTERVPVQDLDLASDLVVTTCQDESRLCKM